MLCLIISSLSISIINSIIDKQELLMREENIGYNYSNILDYYLTPLDFTKSNSAKSLLDIAENKCFKNSESLFLTSFIKDKNDKKSNIKVAIINVKFNYFNNLSVMSKLDTSDMKNSVAIGINLYNKLGKPKNIQIFNKEYKISHILGLNTTNTPFDDCVLLDFRVLNNDDKKAFELPQDNELKFLNLKNSAANDNPIIISFNGAHNEASLGKTDFQVIRTGDNGQTELKKAYQLQRSGISNKIMLMVIGICNIVIVSTFWIIDRKKEIAIRKAFGTNKLQLIMMIFIELFILAFASSIIAIILQYMFIAIGGQYFNFDFNIMPSITNLITVSIAAFIISIIAAIIPVKNAVDMEISQCLKG